MVAGLRRRIDAMRAAAGLQQGAGRSLPTVFFFLQGGRSRASRSQIHLFFATFFLISPRDLFFPGTNIFLSLG
jgi:hypothetical protein